MFRRRIQEELAVVAPKLHGFDDLEQASVEVPHLLEATASGNAGVGHLTEQAAYKVVSAAAFGAVG
jgi:hypothetical protein